MKKLTFEEFDIEIVNDETFQVDSTDNTYFYDLVYHDDEVIKYKSSNHGIKILKNGALIRSAIICAVGGSTCVHDSSAVISENDLLICCANKVFSLSLTDLELNWMRAVDDATCFGIYRADNAFFTHGEMSVCRLEKDGRITWQHGLRDIIVTIDSDQESFILHSDHIELEDFGRNKYKLDFQGRFIEK